MRMRLFCKVASFAKKKKNTSLYIFHKSNISVAVTIDSHPKDLLQGLCFLSFSALLFTPALPFSPVFSSAYHLLSCSPVSSPHSPHLSLSTHLPTCTSLPH